jgi:hypothetical protein
VRAATPAASCGRALGRLGRDTKVNRCLAEGSGPVLEPPLLVSRGCESLYRPQEGLGTAGADRRSAQTEPRRTVGVPFAWSHSRHRPDVPRPQAILPRGTPCPEASRPRMTRATRMSSAQLEGLHRVPPPVPADEVAALPSPESADATRAAGQGRPPPRSPNWSTDESNPPVCRPFQALCRTRTGDAFLTVAVHCTREAPVTAPKYLHLSRATRRQATASIRTVRHAAVPHGYLRGGTPTRANACTAVSVPRLQV